MFQAAPCPDTVSIVEAIIFGANGACVDIGVGSLLGGIALFIGSVVVLRYLGARLIRWAVPSLRRSQPAPDLTPETLPEPAPKEGLQPLPYESPIRSTGAWGAKPR